MYRIVHFMGYGTYLEEHGMDGSRADILEAIGADQPTPLALLERLEELEQVVRAGARGGEGGPVPAVHHPLQQRVWSTGGSS